MTSLIDPLHRRARARTVRRLARMLAALDAAAQRPSPPPRPGRATVGPARR